MEYGETFIPGRMDNLCKNLTVIDVKLHGSVRGYPYQINQSINQGLFCHHFRQKTNALEILFLEN
jgi:hypothetical protein